ncbi:MAG: flavin reductase family protein [Candidatus Atribacteria bacterium]|nr:flavin reductase family protein [Candidatus Atribacteria bacterium]
MVWKKCPWEMVVDKAFRAIQNVGGLLLVTEGQAQKPNVMSIGWFTLGIVWRKPVAVVLVRPSRYSFQLLEENPVFTVNVPQETMHREIELCGSYSGRNTDKFALCGFTPRYGEDPTVPMIDECQVSLLCSVVQKTKVEPSTFIAPIVTEFYPRDDFHFVYFGEIKEAWQKEND